MTTESNNIELPAISAKQAFLNVMAHLVETAYSAAEHTDEWRLDETASNEVIRQQLDDYYFAVQSAAYETARILFGQGVDLIALQPTLRALVEEGGFFVRACHCNRPRAAAPATPCEPRNVADQSPGRALQWLN